jgi:hypothetical protein
MINESSNCLIEVELIAVILISGTAEKGRSFFLLHEQRNNKQSIDAIAEAKNEFLIIIVF